MLLVHILNDRCFLDNMTGIRSTIAKFNQKADDTDRKLAINPFSATYVQPEYDKSADDYGRPKKGSLTEKRGIKASKVCQHRDQNLFPGVHVGREILFLCELIDRTAPLIDADGHKCIEFGPLFYSYAHYSDKVKAPRISIIATFPARRHVATCAQIRSRRIRRRDALSASGRS